MAHQGLGDTVSSLTEIMGIKKIVNTISEKTGKPCGCEARRKKLNELFPYQNTKTQYSWDIIRKKRSQKLNQKSNGGKKKNEEHLLEGIRANWNENEEWP